MILDQIGGSFELAEQIGQIFFFYVFGYLPEFKYSSFYCLLMVFITNKVVRNDIQEVTNNNPCRNHLCLGPKKGKAFNVSHAQRIATKILHSDSISIIIILLLLEVQSSQ